MLAGDTNRRTQNNSDFAQLAVNMMCMNDNTSVQYVGFPPTHCKTIRAEVYYPSCWDGVNLDSANHKSHVAYPAIGNFDGGVCPKSHPVALLSIFYEFFFDTSSYNDTDRFVFANGDTTAYGFHGDFINGWTNLTALQTAHETCLGPTDAECPINTAGAAPGQNQQGPETLIYPAVFEEDIGLTNPILKLPGNNPVNFSINGRPRAKIATSGGAFLVSPGITFPLTATGTLATASIFDILTAQGPIGSVTIRNEADGQYVSADAGGTAPLIANRGGPQGWETFTLTQSGQRNSLYSIVAQANGKLVEVQADGSLLPIATTVGPSSSFSFYWL